MRKVIPSRLGKLIDKGRYAGGVRETFESFLPLLGNKNSGLFFFPEYTDHGPEHIQGVLGSAIELIPEKAWKLLTPDDGVILTLSALLHDVAMVLTSDALLYLLTTENLPMIEELDHTSWINLFDEFYAKARRWDDRHLFQVLGDRNSDNGQDIRDSIIHVRERMDPETWSVRYRKFLGEFVRKHHARIAHEIARYGFPGRVKTVPKLSGISDDLADIAGLIARSHNVSLRSTYDYLESRYDSHVECRNSHPIYIMVLLRIADYLQLDASRVNPGWQSVQRLRSPISQAEWNAHLAIKEIRPDVRDPESLFVSAKPESASTFLKIRSILSGLQSELDTSWAVLSEVFGRMPKLRECGITLRRVRSNLDSEEEFLAKQKPKYFPIHAAFDTAGASLLKLLIRPLYGDRPEIGIRELMQNSLDAVRELGRLREIHSDLASLPLQKQSADVLISIARETDGHYYLSVSDKGIGMTAETVKDYFLKAGASFRQSDAWYRAFASNGKPTVLRSGRFGIGALAAFLLGDRITLRTRHVWSRAEDGVLFEAGIDDDSIELRREKTEVVGTSIAIRLNNNTAEALIKSAESSFYDHAWDWYVFDNPTVERKVSGQKLKQSLTLPTTPSSRQDTNWRRFSHPDYREILWAYQDRYDALPLACNGIRVTRKERFGTGQYSWGPAARQIPCRVPTVSVVDEDAKLPLTLRRDRLETSFFPFSKELADDVAKDFCAYLLLHSPDEPRLWGKRKFYPLQEHDRWHVFSEVGPLLSTSEGSLLLHPWHAKKAKIERIFAATFDLASLDVFSKIGRNISGYSLSAPEPEEFLRALLVDGSKLEDLISPEDRSKKSSKAVAGARLLVMDADSIMVNPEAQDDAGYLMHRLNATNLGGGDFLFEGGKLSAPDNDILSIRNELGRNSSCAVLEIFFDRSKIDVPSSPFTEVWATVMKKPVIPFDHSRRLKDFAPAFRELKDYLELWKNPPSGTWRRDILGSKAW